MDTAQVWLHVLSALLIAVAVAFAAIKAYEWKSDAKFWEKECDLLFEHRESLQRRVFEAERMFDKQCGETVELRNELHRVHGLLVAEKALREKDRAPSQEILKDAGVMYEAIASINEISGKILDELGDCDGCPAPADAGDDDDGPDITTIHQNGKPRF